MVSLHLAPEALRAESAALVKLARALLHHTHDAEDAAQDAWVAALEHEPDASRDVRPWLATVTRNLTRRRRRQRARVATREQTAAYTEALPATSEVVERVEIHRRVVDAVLALDAPYRDVILLRFWDGLPPRRIARLLGLPVATVRTRVHRGLVQVRARLDRLGGGRAAWMSSLALRVPQGPGSGAAASTTSVITALALMSTPVKAVVAAVVAAVLLAVSWQAIAPIAPPIETSSLGAATMAAPDATVDVIPTAKLADRSAVSDSDAPTSAEASARHVIGRVVADDTEQPMAGAQVRLMGRFTRPRAPLPVGTTDADGRFAIRVTQVQAGNHHHDFEVFAADHARWFGDLNRRRDQLEANPIDLGDLRVPRGARVGGRVVDGDGRAVSGAKLFFLLDSERGRACLPFEEFRDGGVSAADGTFALVERLGPTVFGGHVLLALTETEIGWAQVPVVVGRASLPDVVLSVHATASLEVRVEDESGAPIEGARVRVHPRFAPFVTDWWTKEQVPGPWPNLQPDIAVTSLALTNAQGIARLSRLPLEAAKQGSRYDVKGFVDGCVLASAEPVLQKGINAVTLVMRSRHELAITGTVTDPSGVPIAHATVTASDEDDRTTETGPDGRYALSAPSPISGTVWISARAEGYASDRRSLPLPEGDFVSADFALQPAFAIEGRVIDQFGAPVSSVSLSLLRDGQQIGLGKEIAADGRFCFANATAGTWRMHIWPLLPGEFEPGGELEVAAGTRGVEVVLRRIPPGSCRVIADVVDVRTGQPVDPIRALLWRLPLSFGTIASADVKLAAGGVRSAPIQPGQWQLHMITGEGTEVVRDFEISPGETEKRLRVEVGPPGVVLVRVDFDRLPSERRPERVSLVVLPNGDGQWVTAPGVPAPNVTKGFATVERDGTREVRIERMPIGKRMILRTADDSVFGEAEVTVPLEGEARVTVTLALPGYLVFDIEGMSVGAIGELSLLASGSSQANLGEYWTAKEGRHEHMEIPVYPGDYEWRLRVEPPRLSAGAQEDVLRSGTVTVTEGGRVSVRVDVHR